MSLALAMVLATLQVSSATSGPLVTPYQRAFGYVSVVKPRGQQQLRRAVISLIVNRRQTAVLGAVMATTVGDAAPFPDSFVQLVASPDNHYLASLSRQSVPKFVDMTLRVSDLATGGSVISGFTEPTGSISRAFCGSSAIGTFLHFEGLDGATPAFLASYDYRYDDTRMASVDASILGWTGATTVLVAYTLPIVAFGPSRPTRNAGRAVFQMEFDVLRGTATPLNCNADRTPNRPSDSVGLGAPFSVDGGQVMYRKSPVDYIDRSIRPPREVPLRAHLVGGNPY